MLFLLGISLGFGVSAQSFLSPKKEYRTINTDSYEVVLQKNGAITILTPMGEALFQNVMPAILYADKEAPRRLKTDSVRSTRFQVNDRLGQGQGFTIAGKEAEWYISTYPSKPFLTTKVIYHNKSKKPVVVRRLSPWTVGVVDKGGMLMGAEADQSYLLDNGSLFRSFNDYVNVNKGKISAQWNLIAFNPVAGYGTIAGFLTFRKAQPEITMSRSEKAPKNAFDYFSADSTYDPPVTVPAGGSLESEVFYVTLSEHNLFTGMERFGKAVAVANGVRDERPFMPHGWDSWSTRYHSDINAAIALENLDFVDKHLKRYGWTHFALDDGWQRGLGDWDTNTNRFPEGMKAFADEVHRRGMTTSLWWDPFSVSPDAPVAREHPNWMLEPKPGLSKMIIGQNKYILDTGRAEVCAWIRDQARKITQEWGYDGIIEADFVYFLLLVDSKADPSLTHVELLQRGMAAVREGMGPDKFLVAMTPQPINAQFAQGIRTGRDCAPVWKAEKIGGNWGAVDTLTNVMRRYYQIPHLFLPDPDCAFFEDTATRKRWNIPESKPALTMDQSIAWLTGAAFTGGMVKTGNAFVDLTPDQVAVLRRLLPVPSHPAIPIDFFGEQSPRIWGLPMDGPSGKWQFLLLFNWDEKADTELTVSSAMLGLEKGRHYTVYDFWAGRYGGTMADMLKVKVPPASVRLLGLRPLEDHPMFLASDHHILQGAADFGPISWESASQALRGEFPAIADTDYTLRFLLPEGWDFVDGGVSCGAITTSLEDRVLVVRFHTTTSGSASYKLNFRKP